MALTKDIVQLRGFLLMVIRGPLYVSVSATQLWGNVLRFGSVLELGQ